MNTVTEQGKKQKVNGGSLRYEIHGEEVHIAECMIEESCFEIPSHIEGFAVTVIDKKAALSSKNLKELVLPETIWEIGDWAFAHCGNLQKVIMPKKALRFGKGCFKDCGSLTDICTGESGLEERDTVSGEQAREEAGRAEKTAKLLGAVPMQLKSEYLLNPLEAGSKVWLEMYDARLLTLLARQDREGYSRQVLCGEEDLMANLEIYMADVRKEKAELCYLRLVNDIGISEKLRKILMTFLKENTKGCSYEAAWQVLFEKYGSSREHYRIFTEAGCLTEENFDGILRDMGDRNPEMKAFLLRYKEENMETQDFFDSLSLD